MWQFLIKAAIGSIIMKAKPIKKMVKRFMRGAVKKLGKTAGTLIGGAALMIMGGYATNGAYGFGKGFFGGVEGAKQAKSAFDLIGRAKDAFSTAGSEMSSFTEFLKGGVDKVTGNAETGTDLGTGFDTVDPDIGPAESFNPETLLSDSTSNLENIGRRLSDFSERGSPDYLNLQEQQLAEMTKISDAKNFTTAVSDLKTIGAQMINEVPGTTAYQTLQAQQLDAMNAMSTIKDTYTQTALTGTPETVLTAAVAPETTETPWYKQTEQWMKDNPKTTALLQGGLGLLSDQGYTPAYQQDPMMMGVGGYTGYGTSQTEAWRAYSPEYVAYSVDNQLNPNSYVNYMSALG